ncbi:MAG: glucuronate isomerase, partial [Clostridiales bacterium]|nr:glucuronate isomerase [Clostridiales bacterium]
PDKAINIDKDGFADYLGKCGNLTTVGGVEAFLEDRLKFFCENGCKISDHGLDYVPFEIGDPQIPLRKALSGEPLTEREIDVYKTHLLLFCAKLYKKYDVAMQIHFGALRNNNTAMFEKLGPDSGFDSIDDRQAARNLSRLIDSTGDNPKIILYSLNPNDNYTLATMTGNFRNVMFGSAWWFNDQLDGMTDQMKSLANLAPLNKFIGMLTDSRSFLSYPRHEYFRRILCGIVGGWVNDGMFPEEYDTLGTMISDISYNNAVHFLGIKGL